MDLQRTVRLHSFALYGGVNPRLAQIHRPNLPVCRLLSTLLSSTFSSHPLTQFFTSDTSNLVAGPSSKTGTSPSAVRPLPLAKPKSKPGFPSLVRKCFLFHYFLTVNQSCSLVEMNIATDNSIPKDSPVLKWHELMYKAMDTVGLSHTPGSHIKEVNLTRPLILR